MCSKKTRPIRKCRNFRENLGLGLQVNGSSGFLLWSGCASCSSLASCHPAGRTFDVRSSLSSRQFCWATRRPWRTSGTTEVRLFWLSVGLCRMVLRRDLLPVRAVFQSQPFKRRQEAGVHAHQPACAEDEGPGWTGPRWAQNQNMHASSTEIFVNQVFSVCRTHLRCDHRGSACSSLSGLQEQRLEETPAEVWGGQEAVSGPVVVAFMTVFSLVWVESAVIVLFSSFLSMFISGQHL